MSKRSFIAFGALLGTLLPTLVAQAFCPICTIAVGAGVGLSRWLGIDDTITGTWVGGLTVSVSMWTINWLKKKNYTFKGYEAVTVIGYYLLIVVPLFFMGIIGHPFNTLWGVDKLLLGIILGSGFFYLGGVGYDYLKKRNGNKAHFPFQKVVMPVTPLILLSVLFYFITKR